MGEVNGLLRRGAELAHTAVAADQRGDLVAALRDYRLAIEYFQTALKYEGGQGTNEQRRLLIESKCKSYAARVVELDRKLHAMNQQLRTGQSDAGPIMSNNFSNYDDSVNEQHQSQPVTEQQTGGNSRSLKFAETLDHVEPPSEPPMDRTGDQSHSRTVDDVGDNLDNSTALNHALVLRGWLSDNVVTGTSEAVSLRELYHAYASHCELVGARALNMAALRSTLKQIFPGARVRKQTVVGVECPNFPWLTVTGNAAVDQSTSFSPAVDGDSSSSSDPIDKSLLVATQYSSALGDPQEALPFFRRGADLANTATMLDKEGDDQAADQYRLAAAFLHFGLRYESNEATAAAIRQMEAQYSARAAELGSLQSATTDQQGSLPLDAVPVDHPEELNSVRDNDASCHSRGDHVATIRCCWDDHPPNRPDLTLSRSVMTVFSEPVARRLRALDTSGSPPICILAPTTDDESNLRGFICRLVQGPVAKQSAGPPWHFVVSGVAMNSARVQQCVAIANQEEVVPRLAPDRGPEVRWCGGALHALQFYCGSHDGGNSLLPADLESKISSLVRAGRLHAKAHQAASSHRIAKHNDTTTNTSATTNTTTNNSASTNEARTLHYLDAYSDVLLANICELYSWLDLRRSTIPCEESGIDTGINLSQRMRDFAALDTVITERLVEADSVQLPSLRADRKRVVKVLHAADTVLDRAKSPAPVPFNRIRSPSPRPLVVDDPHSVDADCDDFVRCFTGSPDSLRRALDQRIAADKSTLQQSRQGDNRGETDLSDRDEPFKLASLTIDGYCVLFTEAPTFIVLSFKPNN